MSTKASAIISGHLIRMLSELQDNYDNGFITSEEIWKAVSDVGLGLEFENWFYDELQRPHNERRKGLGL